MQERSWLRWTGGSLVDLPPFWGGSPLLRYGVAVLAVGVVLLTKLLIDPYLEEETPFLLFLGAVVVAAWFGGLSAGLLATALAAVASDYFFLGSGGSLRIETFSQGSRLFMFMLEGTFVSLLAAAMRAARERSERSAREAGEHREELRRSEERFRSLVRNGSDIIVILDAKGVITYESPAVERILGHRPEDRIGTSAFDYIHPDDLEVVKRSFEKLVGEPGAQSVEEYRVRDRDGIWRNFEAIGNNLIQDPAIGGVVVNSRDITERRRAEEQLGRSHTLLRSIVEGTSDAIYVKDVHGRYLMVNSSAAKVIGGTAEEILGKSDTRFFPPDAARAFMQMDRRVMEMGEPLQEEEVAPTQGGDLTFLSTKSAYRDHRGEIIGIIGVSTDITRRKQFEAALGESEERYRAVVEQAADGIHLSDVATKRILESNAALQTLLGYTPEEMRGLTIYDIVAHDRESIDANSRRILQKGTHAIGERRYRRKDGSLVDVQVNTSVISYAGRDAICTVAHDITERKAAERRLRRSVNSLLALYEAGQILGSTLEIEEIGTRLLQIMRRISGLTTAVISVPDDDGDLSVWRAIGFENLWRKARYTPKVQDALRAALATAERQRFELRYPDADADDEDRLVVLCLPLRARDRVIGLLEIYGPENLMEGDTEEILGSLANQAASALENGRLYGELAGHERRLKDLVGKLLAAQEEERRRVAYDVHDGLTQVAIAAYQHLQVFAEDHAPASAAGREQLEQVVELARQTVGEARQVIAGLRPTALDDFGLATAIRTQLDDLAAEGWEVSFEEALGNERLPVALETALFRVAQEALTNVRKHAQTTKVEVTLKRMGNTIRLRVRDRGRGFRRVEPAGGPGERVGLSSMQERVSLLGGAFELRSEPGAGTTLTVEVPLEDFRHAG